GELHVLQDIDLHIESGEVVVVTHEMGFAQEVANRVVFMDEGRIIEIAPPTDFFTNPQSPRRKAFLSMILTN
ncbi:MAG: peptide ABC transporter ATP-binding protein, partial [Desulfobacterales bacterium]